MPANPDRPATRGAGHSSSRVAPYPRPEDRPARRATGDAGDSGSGAALRDPSPNHHPMPFYHQTAMVAVTVVATAQLLLAASALAGPTATMGGGS
jgi:hypothetical protein